MHSCTFIGHRDCPSSVKPELIRTIEDLIKNQDVTKFYVGTHGSFDRIVYMALCELEKKYKIEIFVVLAYLNQNTDYYDINKTIYPEGLEKVPLKFAINKRNLYMIDKSEYIISFIDNSFSNSYSFVEKAIKKHLTVINLGSLKI